MRLKKRNKTVISLIHRAFLGCEKNFFSLIKVWPLTNSFDSQGIYFVTAISAVLVMKQR